MDVDLFTNLIRELREAVNHYSELADDEEDLEEANFYQGLIVGYERVIEKIENILQSV
jgi:hypothetical protein